MTHYFKTQCELDVYHPDYPFRHGKVFVDWALDMDIRDCGIPIFAPYVRGVKGYFYFEHQDTENDTEYPFHITIGESDWRFESEILLSDQTLQPFNVSIDFYLKIVRVC